MTYRAWNTKTVDRAALKELTAAIAQQNTEELEYQNMDEEWLSIDKAYVRYLADQKILRKKNHIRVMLINHISYLRHFQRIIL